MRKIFLFFLVVLLIAGCAPNPYRKIKNIHAAKGTNLICFGDSLTAGEGAGTGQDYPNLLAAKVTIPVINAGSSGATTAQALAMMERNVLDNDPKIVIVEFGANDYIQSGGSTAAMDNAFSNLALLINQIQKKGAVVILADVNINSSLSSRFSNLARTTRSVYIPDIMDGITHNPDLMSDSLHPNSAGYVKMADTVFKYVQPVLEEMKNYQDDNPAP